MPTSLIIGSGPAAAGAALALARDPEQRITVLDVGATLEEPTTRPVAYWRTSPSPSGRPPTSG